MAMDPALIPPDSNKDATESAKDFYANYSDYNKQVRTWFVTFGLGGPALFFTNPALLERLSESSRALVVWAFLGGCLVQVLLALINKYLSLSEYTYQACLSIDLARQRSPWQKACEVVSRWSWIDLAADAFTLLLFIGAIIGLVSGTLESVAVRVLHTDGSI